MVEESQFAIDWWALLGLWIFGLVALAVWAWAVMRARSRIFFSDLSALSTNRLSWRRRLHFLPKLLLVLALFFFGLAFIDPHFKVKTTPDSPDQPPPEESQETLLEEVDIPTEGIALYLVLDRSGSMNQELEFVTKAGSFRKMRRIDFLREVTAQFVKGNKELGLPGRPSDLIGLIAFARVPEILTPLTLDHETVLDHLLNLDIVRKQELDGTAIGYAIYKTTHLIAASKHFAEQLAENEEASYDIKNQVIVLVTDGLQSPSPLDAEHPRRTMMLRDAAASAREKGVRVYIVNVEPAIRDPRYSRYLKDLQQTALVTGGRFFIADTPEQLLSIYAEIDKLEKSLLPQSRRALAEVTETYSDDDETPFTERDSYYPRLIGMGLICLFNGLLLGCTWLRRVP